MRVITLKQWVAAALLLLLPCVANTAGMGRLTVLSALGHPFSAEIDLVNVQKEELSSLTATLAPPGAYQTANLQYNSALVGMRVSIERRPNGQPFIKLTSTRPVAEPFLDLLVQLTWSGNKIVREYSALLDPPGMETPAPAVSAPVTAPAARPAPATAAPAEASAPTPSAPVAAPSTPVAPSASSKPITGSEYAVKRGDTLGAIAATVKPDGVTLEQTLIGLFRANPDAFINSNINLVKAGKILRVPDREQVAAVAQGEAAREVRMHSTNWNAYRQKLAENAPAAAETAPATSGKITARVEDKAGAAGAKDVVVLSKGEPAGAAAKGKDGGKAGADRIRALEEDLAARDKALAEAKDRVAQLEKTIQNMQKLAELKSPGMAAAQQAGKPEPPAAPKPDAAKPEPAKAADAAIPDVATAATDKPAAAPEPPKAAQAPKPKPKPVAPPPPAPGIMDTVMDNIVPIGGGAAILGLAGWWLARRRKQGATDDEPEMAAPTFKTEPFTGNVGTTASAVGGDVANVSDAEIVASADGGVDPIEEAQVYIDHGRDTQAEEILKEAMSKDPQREDVQLKLLEVYASRGDKTAFNTVAEGYHRLTGGIGDHWPKVAGMGYALDPSNALYASAAGTDVADITAGDEAGSATVDLDLGADDMGTTTDIVLDSAEENLDKTMVLARDDLKSAADAGDTPLPAFNLDLPPAAAPKADKPAASADAPLDFNLDLPPASTPHDTKPAPASSEDAGMDFKVDFSNIDLKLDDAAPAAAGDAKDAHWNDVQQKFDLARAYQDMGDKDGAKEILREVIKEGDAQQQTEAKNLLESIK